MSDKCTGSGPPFQWTQGHVDALNKWMEQTTETLQRILYQLKVFHEDLLEKHVHKPSSRCPLCRDQWLKRQQDAEKEDDRKDHATIG
jgi:hypothetical protein